MIHVCDETNTKLSALNLNNIIKEVTQNNMNLNIMNNVANGSLITPEKSYDNAELLKTTIFSPSVQTHGPWTRVEGRK